MDVRKTGSRIYPDLRVIDYDTPMLLAGIIVTIILGIATYQVISVLEDKFLYWHESKN